MHLIIYTWEQPQDLLWFKWKSIRIICKYLCKCRLITEVAVTSNGMTVLQILEYFHEDNHGRVQL